ncbi:hypothetical protein B0H16DRAFT_1688226 [Mycena metata]|uniref:Uncharacterized protein n=1 Tax=Mycena metata TaxID=1033252 RepID=A0AAD7JDS7_9AGAR|nr:hypothetical protein B0H16DRAFT_1688226 [Mycena metata]
MARPKRLRRPAASSIAADICAPSTYPSRTTSTSPSAPNPAGGPTRPRPRPGARPPPSTKTFHPIHIAPTPATAAAAYAHKHAKPTHSPRLARAGDHRDVHCRTRPGRPACPSPARRASAAYIAHAYVSASRPRNNPAHQRPPPSPSKTLPPPSPSHAARGPNAAVDDVRRVEGGLEDDARFEGAAKEITSDRERVSRPARGIIQRKYKGHASPERSEDQVHPHPRPFPLELEREGENDARGKGKGNAAAPTLKNTGTWQQDHEY